MEITIEREGSGCTIKINGRLDTTTSADFEQQISSLIRKEDKNIKLDCENLLYISSSGLRIFLMLHKRISTNGGTLQLLKLRKEINEVFNITGFRAIFSIVD